MTAAIDNTIKSEWSRQLNIEFIDDYKKLKVIWDPSMKHLKIDRIHAIKRLSEKYKLTPDEVRGRIKVLRTSFHREHIKVLKSLNSDEEYVPRWYGYELMKFIVDDIAKDERKIKNEVDDSFHISDATIFDINFLNYEQMKQKENEIHNIENNSEENELPKIIESNTKETNRNIFKSPKQSDKSDDEKNTEEKPQEIIVKCDNILYNSKELIEISNDNLDVSMNHNQTDSDSNAERPLPCKRTKMCTQNFWEKDFFNGRPFCHCHCNNREKDEFVIFGENVAVTLKNLKNSKSKVIAKHMINNILFEAQMGKYDQ